MRSRERSRGRARGRNRSTPREEGWSAAVSRQRRALVLEAGVFTWDDPARIAESLRRSAEASTTRKAGPYASAMSMLSFFVNRAGRTLPPKRRRVLARAKRELRRLFGRPPAP
jgi:hypothetical protein